ncbi:MAG: hypothetical protein KF744_07145 [Taibaiella sp.]|nr:hypothetical protein [Taibaiella sp.]
MQWMYWLIAIVIALIAALFVYRADKKRAVPYPWLTSSLRGIVVLAAALLALMPDIVITKHTTEQPIVLFLHDNSTSAGTALGKDTTTYRTELEALADKLSGKYRVVAWGFGADVQKDSLFTYDRQSTDISNALAQAGEYFGLQNLGAIVLASDGRFNRGMNPAYGEYTFNGSLFTIALGDSTREKDLRLARTYSNKTVALNSTFEIRADVVAELCKGYNSPAILREENEDVATSPVSISGDKFDRSLSFTVKATKAGLHHYVITLPDAGNEKNLGNNRRDIFVEVVDEKKKILIASAAPHPDINALKEALSSLETYEVVVRQGENFPQSLADYDAVILHGLPSARFRISPILETARKPMWFVVSGQTDILALNALREFTHTGLAAQPIHDAQATYHSAFNAFTVPPRIQVVTDKMPPLTSYTGNIIAAPGTNVLFTQRTPAGTMPAWCMQQGRVPTAILAGEGLWRWRMYEYKNFDEHDVIDECIRQTVAFLCTNNTEKPFYVQMARHIWSDQEPVSLSAYVLNANNEQVNTSDVSITIKDSSGKKQDYSFERSGSGYSLNLGIHAPGRYTYSAHTAFNGKEMSADGSFVVESTPIEQMETGADYSLLYGLAKRNNGAFFTLQGIPALFDSISNNQKIKPVIRTETENVPLVDRKWYFFIILAFAVAEWLLRKYWLAQ